MPRKLSSYRLLTDAEEAGNTREYGEYAGNTVTLARFPFWWWVGVR